MTKPQDQTSKNNNATAGQSLAVEGAAAQTRFHFNFMRLRNGIAIFSLVSMVLSILLVGIHGLHYGLDFTGGVVLELEYKEAADLDQIREHLKAENFAGAMAIPYGSERDVLVRLPPQENANAIAEQIVTSLGGAEKLTLKRTDVVGAQVGEDLQAQAVLAVLVAMFAVLIYVALRFEKKFAIGAVVGLAHDVVVVLGLFALFGWDFDLTVLAAVLAIIGYSLNDSIVVADRIRENFRKYRHMSAEEIVDYSINQTLDRTIITALTVWLVVLALYLVGGEALHGFSLALLIGIFVGTYSSIYVAANVALMMKVSREDFLPPVREGESETEKDLSADMP